MPEVYRIKTFLLLNPSSEEEAKKRKTRA